MMRSGASIKCSAGFTLVELMVALVIGLIIVLGAGQLFLMGKQTYDRVVDLSSRQESLRYLTDILSLDIRTASGVDLGDGSAITLEYGTGMRPDDPHCSGGGLVSVEYTKSNDEILIEVQCDGPGSYGPEPLVGGVADFSAGGGGLGYVLISVEFDAIRGEDQESATFDFVVARREEILSRL
jgi:prepilin-type N-terminal cleavage/methylation domain-containing protein